MKKNIGSSVSISKTRIWLFEFIKVTTPLLKPLTWSQWIVVPNASIASISSIIIHWNDDFSRTFFILLGHSRGFDIYRFGLGHFSYRGRCLRFSTIWGMVIFWFDLLLLHHTHNNRFVTLWSVRKKIMIWRGWDYFNWKRVSIWFRLEPVSFRFWWFCGSTKRWSPTKAARLRDFLSCFYHVRFGSDLSSNESSRLAIPYYEHRGLWSIFFITDLSSYFIEFNRGNNYHTSLRCRATIELNNSLKRRTKK